MEKWLNILKNYVDDFVLFGRIMPILTMIFPIVIYGIFKGFIKENVFDTVFYFGLVLVFLIFASKIVRERGKEFEKKMYKQLGAKPTTIILRYSDSTIDSLTKTRYHMHINEKMEDIMLPLKMEDEDKESDNFYETAMNYLRKYANSNRESEPRVYQELKEYNYWRNLYGGKRISIFIYGFFMVREFWLIEKFNVKEMFINPYPSYVGFIIMLFSIIIICGVVNKKTVQRRAFDYAKVLAETCERI